MSRPLGATIGLLTLAAVVTAGSQILVRFGGRRSAMLACSTRIEWLYGARWWILGIAIGWCAGLLWAWTIRKVSLTFAFPVFSGMAYIMTLLGSGLLLKETMQPVQWIGAAAILLGMLLIMIPGSGG